MGNKCKFCITGYGGNKYVAGRLVGLGGCGKCNGSITRRELQLMKPHYKNLLELTRCDKENIIEMEKELLQTIEELDKIVPITD